MQGNRTKIVASLWACLLLAAMLATRPYGKLTYTVENTFDFSTGWEAGAEDETALGTVDLSENNNFGKGKTFFFTKRLPFEEEENMGLLILMYQQSMTVYVEGNPIASYPAAALRGKEMYLSKEWVCVKLPVGYGGNQLTLEIQDRVTPASICIDRLWLGNAEALAEHKMRVNSFGGFIGVALVLMGACTCTLSLMSRGRNEQAERAKRLLGLLAGCTGAWYYITHRLVPYLYVNPVLRGFLTMLLSYLSCWLIYALLAAVCKAFHKFLRITRGTALAMAMTFTVFGLLEMPAYGYWTHGFFALLLLGVAFTAAALIYSWRVQKGARAFLTLLLITLACITADRLQDGLLPRVLSGLEYGSVCILGGMVAGASALQRRQETLREERAEKEMMKTYLKAQSEHYRSLYQTMEAVRELTHDTRYHLLAVEAMLIKKQEKSALSYLRNLISQGRMGEQETINTGNPILDAILSETKVRAEKANVIFRLSVSLPQACAVQPQDWCAVMGNALSNALSAASREPAGSVNVELRQTGNIIYGTVQNSADAHAAIIPGIGMRSMKRALLNYCGEMDYALTDGVFTLRFLLTLQTAPLPRDSSEAHV